MPKSTDDILADSVFDLMKRVDTLEKQALSAKTGLSRQANINTAVVKFLKALANKFDRFENVMSVLSGVRWKRRW